MGIVLAFLVGWTAGTQAGPKGYTEVVAALKSVRESEEFAALLEISRHHLSTALREVSKMISGEIAAPAPIDLLERVQRMKRPTL